MSLSSVEFDVGCTTYGQQLRLVWSRASAGNKEWSLFKAAVSQRDEPSSIHGLTDETILAMAEAVQRKRRGF